jgi:arabinose-5-phosphate isomerase
LHFKSGNSPEIKAVVPFKTFWQYANRYNRKHTSFLAKESNYVLNTTVDAEACLIIWPPLIARLRN